MDRMTEKDIAKLEKLNERQRKQNEYLKTKYDRLNIAIPAGKKAVVEQAARDAGKSVNAFCADAILTAARKPENPAPDDDWPEDIFGPRPE